MTGVKGYSETLLSAEPMGLDVSILEVEIHATSGLPRVDIVGLAETCVRESKQRVRAAISASGWRFPEEKITINLSPPSLKKSGTGLDLAIALGILITCQKIKLDLENCLKENLFLGELSLNGKLKPVPGILSVVLEAKNNGIRKIFLPIENVKEAGLISGILLYPVRSLKEVCDHLEGIIDLSAIQTCSKVSYPKQGERKFHIDLVNVKGQSLAKRALILAASGGHNLLFMGPPGSGKTLLMNAFASLLPDLDEEEAMESTKIHCCAGLRQGKETLMVRPPFRSPHHSITDAGFIGGGKRIHPGELSLAHNGVLFLDELPEFKRYVLEMLREPMESGKVLLSRANGFLQYPARFQLLAAMNPCPCGYWGVEESSCECSRTSLQNYTKRISGPLLDRIDIRLYIHPVPHRDFFSDAKETQVLESKRAAKMIGRAMERQSKRLRGTPFRKNANIPVSQLDRYCRLSAQAKRFLEKGLEDHQVSGRGIHRILRLARTLEDLKPEDRSEISVQAASEAFSFWQMPAWK